MPPSETAPRKAVPGGKRRDETASRRGHPTCALQLLFPAMAQVSRCPLPPFRVCAFQQWGPDSLLLSYCSRPGARARTRGDRKPVHVAPFTSSGVVLLLSLSAFASVAHAQISGKQGLHRLELPGDEHAWLIGSRERRDPNAEHMPSCVWSREQNS